MIVLVLKGLVFLFNILLIELPVTFTCIYESFRFSLPRHGTDGEIQVKCDKDVVRSREVWDGVPFFNGWSVWIGESEVNDRFLV